MFFWNALDLTRKLGEFAGYYNLHRVHRALDGAPPAQRAGGVAAPPAALAHYHWQQHCRGLFQTPLAREQEFALYTLVPCIRFANLVD